MVKYSHVPAHLRAAFVEYMQERRIGVVHLLRHSQLEVYLSWQDNLSRRKNPASPVNQHVIDLMDFQAFRYTTYADSSYFRQALASDVGNMYHEVAYESLASPVVGGTVWMALLNFLKVEVRPPVDTPVHGSAVRLPCAARILNWRELLNPSLAPPLGPADPTRGSGPHDDAAATAAMAASVAADFRASQLVALCATDAGETKVDGNGFVEARRHVTTMHQHSPSCKAQLDAFTTADVFAGAAADGQAHSRRRPKGAGLPWLFRRFLEYPLIKGGVALRITSQWNGLESEHLPFSAEVSWLRDCLGFVVNTYASVEEAAYKQLVVASGAVVKPVTLVMLDWDDERNAGGSAYPPPTPLKTPVPVRLVWVVGDGTAAGSANQSDRRMLEAKLQQRLSFMGMAWDWDDPGGWVWDLRAVGNGGGRKGGGVGSGGGGGGGPPGYELLLHDRSYYPSICRYGDERLERGLMHQLVSEGPLPCGW